MLKPLTELRSQECGRIFELKGGQELIDRLNALGIVPGQNIKKISTMMMHGPVTVQINRSVVAIGFGMAQKIIVETGQE